MTKSIIYDKAYAFALRIINLYKYLCAEQKMYLLARQVLRSGTSIGANAAEATAAHTRKEFSSKIAIALKEARETAYWLHLLHASGYIEKQAHISIQSDCQELIRMLSATILTTKKREQNKALD